MIVVVMWNLCEKPLKKLLFCILLLKLTLTFKIRKGTTILLPPPPTPDNTTDKSALIFLHRSRKHLY